MSEFTIFIKLGENDLYEDSEVCIQFVKSSEAPQQDMTNIVSPDYIHITHIYTKLNGNKVIIYSKEVPVQRVCDFRRSHWIIHSNDSFGDMQSKFFWNYFVLVEENRQNKCKITV